MQHELLETLAEQRVDLLLIGGGAERDGRERLGLAAGEHGGAMGAWEDLHVGAYIADVGGLAIVDSLVVVEDRHPNPRADRKSTRLNSSHLGISYAVSCLKKK